VGVGRRRVYAVTPAARRTGVTPDVVLYFEAAVVLITRSTACRGMPPAEITHAPVLRRVAASLRRFHSGAPFPGIFSAFETVLEYLRICREAAPLPARIDWMADQAAAIHQAMQAVPRPRCPCHNDLLLANFLDDGELIRIIDWEYAAMGDPYFDLGNFAVHQGLDDNQEMIMLEAYFG